MVLVLTGIITVALIMWLAITGRGRGRRRGRVEDGQRHGVVRVDGRRHAVDAAQQLAPHQRHHPAHGTDIQTIFIIIVRSVGRRFTKSIQ